jgi:DNA ligase (NAD+)
MNIVGLSEQTIRLFLEKGWISEPIDFYNDKLYSYYLDLINTDGWSNISADKLFKAIDDSRNVKLENAINSLGIDGVGIKASKDIAKYCEYNWHNFVNPEYYEHFDRIEGFGEITSSNISVYIDIHKDDISNLFSKFNFIDKTVEFAQSAPNIMNKTFVITGSLNHYKNRDELVNDIERFGGKVACSVSTKTDYLINNDVNSNSGKNKKAKELGLPIITEEDFMKLFMKSCIDDTIDEFISNPNKTMFTNFDAIHNNLSSNSNTNTNSLKTHKKLF